MLVNPRNLYSGGQGLFDSSPYRAAYERNQRLKAAKEEALNKYFTELPNKINSAGVRDAERPVIDRKLLDIKKFGIENKDAIAKGGAARFNYEKEIQGLSNLIDESKQLGKSDLQFGKAYWNKDMAHVFDDPEFMEKKRRNDLPIGDPEHQSFNFSEAPPLRPFDVDKNKKVLNVSIKPDETKPLVTKDPSDPLYDIVTQVPVFGEQKLNALRSDALMKVDNDPSFKAFINKASQSAETKALLQKTFKEVFKEDLNDDYDAAAAFQYLQLVPPPQKVKRVIDAGAMNKARGEEWDRRNRLTFRQSMQKIAANKQGGISEDTGYLSDEVASEVGEDMETTFGGEKRVRRVIFVDKVDPDRLDIIRGRDLNKKQIGVKPIPMKTPDGKIRFGYYQDLETGDWEGENGQVISRERVKDAYVNKYAPSKFKSQSNTKASENTQGKTPSKITSAGLPIIKQ